MIEYQTWLAIVADAVHLTPEQVEEQAGDEPQDAYDEECTPLEYARYFVSDAIEMWGETEPFTQEYATKDGIRKIQTQIAETTARIAGGAS